MIYTKFGILSLVIVMLECSTKQETNNVTYRHQNGLIVALPQSFVVTQTVDGFLVKPKEYRELRFACEIKITFHMDKQKPEGEWPKTRTIEGRQVYYRTEKAPGGSGGDLHTLWAWESYPNSYILYQGTVQAEGKPNFKLIWSIVKGEKTPNVKE